MSSDWLWTEKYRPKNIDQCILPERIKNHFYSFVKEGDFPHLLLSGPPGVGKTTIARALVNELGRDCMEINASLSGNIETLRSDIQAFASTVSLTSEGRKYIILDEADYLTHATQPALRNFMESFAGNCGFILTANNPSRIIPALRSRCEEISFVINKDELKDIAKDCVVGLAGILKQEGVGYDKKVLVAFVKKHFPHFRKMITELQSYAIGSEDLRIDQGILTSKGDANVLELMGFLKSKNYPKIKEWVFTHTEVDPSDLVRQIVNGCENYTKKSNEPELILICADYLKWDSLVADRQLNVLGMLTEIVARVEMNG